jgi:hypothetical protein
MLITTILSTGLDRRLDVFGSAGLAPPPHAIAMDPVRNVLDSGTKFKTTKRTYNDKTNKYKTYKCKTCKETKRITGKFILDGRGKLLSSGYWLGSHQNRLFSAIR